MAVNFNIDAKLLDHAERAEGVTILQGKMPSSGLPLLIIVAVGAQAELLKQQAEQGTLRLEFCKDGFEARITPDRSSHNA